MQTETEEVRQKKNMTDILIGIGVALLAYVVGSIMYGQYRDYVESAPASNWVEVTKFVVPDFETGANPNIDYKRIIKQEVSSSWNAEIRRYDGETYSVVCNKAGFSELDPFRAPPIGGWNLGSFVDEECVDSLKPGVHRLSVIWELRPRGLDRTILYPFSSNAFNVLGEE
jgi:hypothetical protein